MSVTGEVLIMPKLQYRWSVRFDGFGGGVLGSGLPGFGSPVTAQAIEVSRPKLVFEDIPIPMYNTVMYIPGRPHWDPITIKIKDDSGNGSTNDVAQQIRKVFDFQDANPSMNAAAAGASLLGHDFKFYTYIDMLDGGTEVIEKWKLIGCYIQNVDYGTMNYGTSDVTTITLSIRFDNMQQIGGKAEWDLSTRPTPVDAVEGDT